MVCQDHGSQFEGLKILVQISNNNSQGKSKNKVLLKLDAVRLSSTRSSSSNEFSCYLKSCFLCKKKLSLDKDVYMYRGDQGFCSIECRNKRIVSDEMKELESSTKHMVASYRYNNCRTDNRRETQLLLAELRRNRHKSNKQQPQHQKVHWAIVS